MPNKLKYIFLLIFILIASSSYTFGQEFGIENIKNDKIEAVNQFYDIAEDKRGVMYFANPAGVYEYDGLSWRLITLPKKSGAYCLATSEKGRIYVGGTGQLGYLTPTRKGEMVFVSLKSKLPEKYREFDTKIIKTIVSGSSIIFFSDYFLFILDEKNEKFTAVPSFMYFYSITSVNNKIYVVDEKEGLMSLEGAELKRVKGGKNLISYFMMPYEKDKLLIISPNEGMIVYTPKSNDFKNLGKQIIKYDIKSGTQLKNGNLAFGSVSNGCIITNKVGHELKKINKESGLVDNAVYCVVADDYKNIWLGLSRGVSLVYDNSEYKKGTKKIDEKENTKKGKKKEEKLDTLSNFKISVRSCNRRKDESLVFGGAFANITDSVQSEIQPKEQTYQFHYQDNSFRFTFASTQYHSTSNFKYKYFLEGYDTEWTSWTDRPYSEYTNLNWGEFVLKVQAKNERGYVSKIGTYSFSIDIPWYESWWFFAAQVGFLLSLLVISILMYRAGKSERLAGRLITIVVVVVFEYGENVIAPVFELLAIGIALTMFLSSVVVATVVAPVEIYASKLIRKIVRRKSETGTELPNAEENDPL